jgi:tetratricopeptide (TPR) repeat protein
VAEGDAAAYVVRAQRSLEAGRFEDAREAIETGYALEPDDERVRDFYQQILMADGVRLTRQARDMRRDEIRALSKRDRGSYADSAQVRRAFEEALKSMDKVLAVNPDNAKALMLKAGILDRMDRNGRRQEVMALFDRALKVHPGNEELLYARERIVRACGTCGDTGLCPDCKGAGEVSALRIRSRCPSCKGSGICTRCGIF